MSPPSDALAERLRARIAAEGPLPFSEFMRAALYDPEHGYYMRKGFTTGRAGDFATAPDAGPLLGATLARAVSEFGREKGQLVELGPGSGRLMADVLANVSDGARQNLQVTMVEPSAARASALRRILENSRTRGAVVSSLPEVRPGRTLLLANEVLDALPATAVRRHAGAWQELHVVGQDSRFFGAWRPASPVAASFAARHAPDLEEDHLYEANLEAGVLLDEVARSLAPGCALFLDYGGEHAHVWRERPEGTLRGYRGHRMVDPLTEPGATDITFDVDVTAIREEARARGLACAYAGPQENLLVHLGLLEVAQEQKLLTAAKQLLVPGAFAGRFQAILVERGGVATSCGLAPRP